MTSRGSTSGLPGPLVRGRGEGGPAEGTGGPPAVLPLPQLLSPALHLPSSMPRTSPHLQCLAPHPDTSPPLPRAPPIPCPPSPCASNTLPPLPVYRSGGPPILEFLGRPIQRTAPGGGVTSPPSEYHMRPHPAPRPQQYDPGAGGTAAQQYKSYNAQQQAPRPSPAFRPWEDEAKGLYQPIKVWESVGWCGDKAPGLYRPGPTRCRDQRRTRLVQGKGPLNALVCRILCVFCAGWPRELADHRIRVGPSPRPGPRHSGCCSSSGSHPPFCFPPPKGAVGRRPLLRLRQRSGL